MRKVTLTVIACVAAPFFMVAPAQAATATSVCDPSIKKIKLGDDIDQPAKGKRAVPGVRVKHIPKGFEYGEANFQEFKKAWTYAYLWGDNRNDVDPKHRNLWVRVICWDGARKLKDLKKAPVDLGNFTPSVTTVATVGGRRVLSREGDGALGHGRMVGWVERPGVAITVMASQPLVKQLDKIVKGVVVP